MNISHNYKLLALFCLGSLLFLSTNAQDAFSSNSYPQNYFRNPLDIPILLAGNFGECRPNHFHTGLDIKTNGKENLPVYAAAEGYVSRISVSHSGYGNCLYITHPNGYVTVYAHLNSFFTELEQNVIQEQYTQERWALDITIPKEKFHVSKGQLVAYSGNTGGSTAPHLHFEIRNATTEHVLNGGLFGLAIQDNIAPTPKSIAIYENGDVYGITPPRIITVKKSGENYTLSTPLISVGSSHIRMGVLADDKMLGSSNSLGIYSMELLIDQSPIIAWQLNNLDFSFNRDVNAFADFKLKEQKGIWYEGLYQLLGNRLNIYKDANQENGLVNLSNKKVHTVQIVLKDFSGNTSSIDFQIQYVGANSDKKGYDCNTLNPLSTQQLNDRFFVFRINNTSGVYDTVCATYSIDSTSKKLSAVLQLLSTEIPLSGNCSLSMKLLQPIPFSLRSKLAFIHHVKAASLPGNNPQSGMAAIYEDGWVSATINTFGNYYVVIDTIPPTISTSIKNGSNLSSSKSISFSVEEKITSVMTVRPELDGKWLRFVRRGNTYTYTFDEHCPKGNHILVIKAVDENDNAIKKTITFTR